jgi:DNA-binding SARP family transcriptional activator
MSHLHVSLFGKFCARCGERVVVGLDARKVQELFGYLLLYGSRPHHRETLANLLWREHPPGQSKSYLRRTLWQLQNTILNQTALDSVLRVEADWIQVDYTDDVWVDVAAFEQVFAGVKGKPGGMLEEAAIRALDEAVQLYQGDLMEGCYQDWCLFERERLQQMLLLMLDKLMEHHESHGAYEDGIACGMQILRYDYARERTHRRLMRLRYLAGDRTGALRQYEWCRAVLREELGVEPATSTERLRAQTRADRLETPALTPTLSPPLQRTLQRLQKLEAVLSQTRRQIQQEIHHVEDDLSTE